MPLNSDVKDLQQRLRVARLSSIKIVGEHQRTNISACGLAATPASPIRLGFSTTGWSPIPHLHHGITLKCVSAPGLPWTLEYGYASFALRVLGYYWSDSSVRATTSARHLCA